MTAVHGSYVTPPPGPEPVPGTAFELPADLVLVAIGFSHPEHTGAVEQLALDLDRRGNLKAPTYETSHPACSPPATRGSASRSWSPRSPRAGAARASSTAIWRPSRYS